MDFWTRLIGGVGTPKSKQPSTSKNPQQRLARFKRVYDHLLHIWHKSKQRVTGTQAEETIRNCLQRITSILRDESHSPEPHLCLALAASSQIFSNVSKIAYRSRNERIIKDAVAFFAVLVESEEEFLDNAPFAESLMTFISNVSGPGNAICGEDTIGEIVELLFGIAAKIRLQPEILSVWFSTRKPNVGQETAGTENTTKPGFVGVTQKEDFPLCYYLVDHVHHEGRVGDFARTGLLYIFESASKSAALEQWIVESDLATLMASGLGALYSQLSRKLSISHAGGELPIVLALSDYAQTEASPEADSVSSPQFNVPMNTFMSYLAFWQDLLEYCKSIDVRQTLLDHFQVLFLQQLLYPSVLESSDADGGSAVAVLTYIRCLLETLDHPELIHMILTYLLALPDLADATRPRTPLSPIAAQRRESLMLLTQANNEEDRLNPSLFNLADLVLSSSQSQNPQTVISALRLISVFLRKHWTYARLFSSSTMQMTEPHRTVGALNAELASYLALAEGLGGESGMDEAYEATVQDVQNLLETHPCSARLLGLNNLGLSDLETVTNDSSQDLCETNPPTCHYLVPSDPLLKVLLRLLSTFLTNDMETNLSLTEAFVALLSCPTLRLEGLLAVNPSHYHFPPDDTSRPSHSQSDERLKKLYAARRQPTWSSEDTPPLLSALQSLQQQLELLRNEIPDLDQHIESRKQAFHIHEEISQAMASAAIPIRSPPSGTQTPVKSGSWTPQLPAHVRTSTPMSARSQSPRGTPAPARGSIDQQRARLASPTPPLAVLGAKKVVASPTSSVSSKAPSRALSPVGSAWVQPSRALADVMGDAVEAADVEVLKRRIRFPLREPGTEEAGDTQAGAERGDLAAGDDEGRETQDGDTEDAGMEAVGTEEEKEQVGKEVSLSHVLTNVVILQGFVLELVALLQVRATLFEEVRYT
ncbi:hypothetical protein H2201_002821 [Coniosporium apollinis]|uniref:FHF complex subunit HOOK-interacting protein C-terminal domain-containing protein n=1 Tax=Coniosporium apollinis TaxID=61459 RepID=A0ABQ9NYF0_9PEZI|nr:hypothetical protein H2201_002821 [Coniosporium apollinis]